MYRRLLELRARTGLPTPTLTVGDSRGRFCFVTAAMAPAAIAVPLDEDQVAELITALSAWRADRAADREPYGRPCRTAQTVPEPRQPSAV